jgi:hypothetical protein
MREMMQFKEKLSGKPVAARPAGGAAGGPTGAESSKAPNQRYFKVSGLQHGVSRMRIRVGGDHSFLSRPLLSLQHVEPLPGESMKSFSRRVKVEMRKRLTEIKTATPAAEAKRMSEGRKAHLDARAEAKRRRKLGLPVDAPLPEAHGGSADADEPPQVSGGKRKRVADGSGDAPSGPSAAKRARQAEGEAASSAAAGAGATSAAGGGSKGALRLGRTATGSGGRSAEAGRGVDKEDFPTDVVRFGERAERPPDLKVAPRKSKVGAALCSAYIPTGCWRADPSDSMCHLPSGAAERKGTPLAFGGQHRGLTNGRDSRALHANLCTSQQEVCSGVLTAVAAGSR